MAAIVIGRPALQQHQPAKEHCQRQQNNQDNLPDAFRVLSGNLAIFAIDHVVIGFAGITITSFPQRHQHLLIAHRIIVGVHTGDLRLAVPMPTDITLCPAALVTVNVAFRNLKSLDTIYRIALRLVTRQVLRMIGVGIADGIVRQHLLNEITAGGFAGTHLDIIIVTPHHTGNRIPLSIGLCLAIPAKAGIGAAITPAVLGHSIGIVGPKGHIHAHKLPFSKGAL